MSDQVVGSPLRVLHFICSTGFYGAERWILALVNNIDPSSGIESQLAVTDESGNRENKLADAFVQRQLKTHRLPMRSAFDPMVIKKLVKTLKEEQIDVIHTHGYKSDIIGLIAGRLAGVKCLTTPHGFENTTDRKLRMYIAAGCRTYRFFDCVAPLSPDLVNQIKPFRVRPEKLRMIGNGVDLTEIEYRKPSAAGRRELLQPLVTNPNTRVIGFIGQMIDRKNIRDLLDAFDQVANRFSAVRLVLIGEGEDLPGFQRHAATLTHSDKVEFLGYKGDALAHLREFDLFAMTSSLEGVPRCLMEAMGCGVPVACYSIPGVDQLIVNEETGLSVGYGDKAALAEQCLRLLQSSELSDQLAERAVSYVNSNFSAARMAKEYTTLYGDLLQ